MSVEENDLRKDLEAAFEKHTDEGAPEKVGGSQENTPEPVRAAEAQPEGTPEAPVKEGRDETGRFVRKDDGAGKPAADGKPLVGNQPQQAEQKDSKSAEETLAAPVGWKAAAREHWKTIPKAAQQEILRRETETSQALNQSTASRKFHNDFNQVIHPFMPMIQAQGSNPLQAVRNLMGTAAGLTIGTSEQKARIIRDIIANYGVDIQTLDKVLAGQPVDQSQQQINYNNTPPQWAAPIFQFMNGIQQQQQTRQQQIFIDAESETQQFAAKNEFFEDVREDMADLMEMAARRGVVMNLQTAYEKAVSMDPDLAAVVQQRKAAAAANGGNVAKARAAASSVVGNPRNGPTGAQKEANSRRDDIEAAWEAQSGR